MRRDVSRPLCLRRGARFSFLILSFATGAGGWLRSASGQEQPKAAEVAKPPLSPPSDAAKVEAEQPKGLVFTDMSGEPLEKVLKRLYLSASVRVRPEFNSNLTDFNSSLQDQSEFFSSRFRLGIGADLPFNTGVFIEAQNNSTWGDDSAFSNMDASGDDNVKIYQAYGEARRLGDSDFSVRVGRQELRYGTEMLLGDADFGPGLSHDAVKLTYEKDALSVHAWFAKEVDQTGIPGANPFQDNDVDFLGVYSTYTCSKGTGLDAYYLYLRDPRPAGATPLPDDRRHTLGARGFAEPELDMSFGLLFSSEVAWQFGNSGVNDHSIRAFAWETTANAVIKDNPYKPKATIGYAFASGDNDPNDSKNETFNPLFEDNHPRLGYSDVFSLSNLHAVTVTGTVKPFEHVEPGLGYYAFWVHRTMDGSAPSSVQPGLGNTPGGNHFIGHEVNVFVNFDWTKHLVAQVAWAHLIPGEFIKNQFASGDGADRVYLQMVAGF